jgi:hypothetical protein
VCIPATFEMGCVHVVHIYLPCRRQQVLYAGATKALVQHTHTHTHSNTHTCLLCRPLVNNSGYACACQPVWLYAACVCTAHSGRHPKQSHYCMRNIAQSSTLMHVAAQRLQRKCTDVQTVHYTPMSQGVASWSYTRGKQSWSATCANPTGQHANHLS